MSGRAGELNRWPGSDQDIPRTPRLREIAGPWCRGLLVRLPTLIIVALMLTPLCYLLLRAGQADLATIQQLVFRQRTLDLLRNTLALMGGVTLLCTVIAAPLAWLVTRSDLPGKRIVTILCVLPLAIPGYVMAYSLLSVGGTYGVAAQWFGIHIPRPQGYWGATLALTLYTFPYLFLNIRSALRGFDATLEESAASLGVSRWRIIRSVTIPHLLPGLMAGWLIILLYVMGDFGAIALMRYEVFSYAIYTQYTAAFDRIHAAWLSLLLLSLAAVVVYLEWRVLRGGRYSRTGTGCHRCPPPVRLGVWRYLAWAFIAAVLLAALGFPALILTYWTVIASPSIETLLDVPATFIRSAGAALPAAILAAGMALMISWVSVRHPSNWSAFAERTVYLGYAMPPLTLALAMVFFAMQGAWWLYQTLPLLILAWVLATTALALGPIRSALLQVRPGTEDSARSLGHGPASILHRVTLPQLRGPLVTSVILVFVFLMKELPITLLLSPIGYQTLAVSVFNRTVEGMYAEAAPFAIAIVLFCCISVAIMLHREQVTRTR